MPAKPCTLLGAPGSRIFLIAPSDLLAGDLADLAQNSAWSKRPAEAQNASYRCRSVRLGLYPLLRVMIGGIVPAPAALGPQLKTVWPAWPVSGTEPVELRLLPASRYLIILAVVGCFLAAAALFIYGLLAVVRVVWVTVVADVANLATSDVQIVAGAEHLAVDLIQLADVFLLGTVIYLVGLGLHLLFVNPQLPDQPWIAVSDLDDLKEMLVRVIVLLIGVTFLGSFVEQADDVPVLELGMTSAVVVAAFTLVILVAKLPDWSRADGERPARSDREASEPTHDP